MANISRTRSRAGAPGEPARRSNVDCNAMKGVEPHPFLGAFAPKGADTLLNKRYCCIFILRRSSGLSPGRRSKISPELQFIVYCRVFFPRGRRFPRSPRPFDCCIALGVIYGGRKGSFWLRRVAIRRVKNAHQIRICGGLVFATQ